MALQKRKFYRVRAKQLGHVLFRGFLPEPLKNIRLVSLAKQRFRLTFKLQVRLIPACRMQQRPDAMAPDGIFHQCFTHDFR